MKFHILLCMTLVACGGKKDDTGDHTAGKTVEGIKSEAPSGPFADFGSTDDILKKWQGAWVLETGALGHYEAWEVSGTKVTSWDGKKEQVRELAIDSPCEGRVIENSDGGTSANHMTFVFEGDTLHTGMGDAGIKKGDKILACGAGRTFVFDGKTCTAHDNNFGRWESEPTECKLEGDKFVAKRPGMGDMTATFVIAGDTLMSEQMKGNKVVRAASFAEAKTKLETFKK